MSQLTEKQLKRQEYNKHYRQKKKQETQETTIKDTTEAQKNTPEAQKISQKETKHAHEDTQEDKKTPQENTQEKITISKSDYDFIMNFLDNYEHEKEQQQDSEEIEEPRQTTHIKKNIKNNKNKNKDGDTFFFQVIRQMKMNIATSIGTAIPALAIYFGKTLFTRYQKQQILQNSQNILRQHVLSQQSQKPQTEDTTYIERLP